MLVLSSRWSRDVSAAAFLCLMVFARQLSADMGLEAYSNSKLESLCPPQAPLVPVQVKWVIDGDTVVLADGRHLRIIGVNTPEMNWGKHSSDASLQPYAREATQFLDNWVSSNRSLYISIGNENRDQYGRTLAHLYGGDGAVKYSAAAQLIRQGYGYSLAIPPNLRQSSCLRQVEALARSQGLGLWKDSPYQKVAPNNVLKSGFQLVTGRIINVSKAKKSWWLEFDGPLVLHISTKNTRYFDASALYSLKGKTIVARGWVIDRGERYDNHPKGYRRWMMHISHPIAIEPR